LDEPRKRLSLGKKRQNMFFFLDVSTKDAIQHENNKLILLSEDKVNVYGFGQAKFAYGHFPTSTAVSKINVYVS